MIIWVYEGRNEPPMDEYKKGTYAIVSVDFDEEDYGVVDNLLEYSKDELIKHYERKGWTALTSGKNYVVAAKHAGDAYSLREKFEHWRNGDVFFVRNSWGESMFLYTTFDDLYEKIRHNLGFDENTKIRFVEERR